MTANVTEMVYCLLVDDREENLTALDALLRRDGLQLLKARSGAEALELLLVHDVALALLDVQMPGMDGFELAEIMRGSERTRRVPIIFLTAGTADRRRRFRGYEAGAVDFIQKPVEPDVLRSKAEVFFELYRQRQEVARLLAESRAHAELLQEADRRKDEFLATLAHELRNPLAPMRTGLQILKLSENDPDASSAAREMMERQLTHMVRLIDDLLDVARISQGKVELKREQVTIQSVLEAAVEASAPIIESGEHQFTTEIPREPIKVNVDLVRMAQIVSNLLNNAAKYTPSGGRILLRAGCEDGGVVITVSDSGVGITADMLPRVFDMFIQVSRSLHRSQGGLGIGLSLVKKLVDLHGGSVSADSAGASQGSTFRVWLPLADLEEADDSASNRAPAEQTALRRRVLVVDHQESHDSKSLISLMFSITHNLHYPLYYTHRQLIAMDEARAGAC